MPSHGREESASIRSERGGKEGEAEPLREEESMRDGESRGDGRPS
jgi:hypothetical protein